MDISFKTNVRTVIRYKGQEYSSAEELPEEVRSVYESVFAKGMGTNPGTKQQVVTNDEHFASAGKMPADRKLYENAMNFVQDTARISDLARSSVPSSSGWLTPTQFRLVLVCGLVVAVVVVMRLLL